MTTAIKVPSRPTCSVCGKEIVSGVGRFIASSPGPVPVPEFQFVHSGACAVKAGAVEGGAALVWGEIVELVSAVVDGRSEAACHGGPVRLRAQDGGGFVHVDLLIVAAQGLAVGVLAWAVLKVVVKAIAANGGF